MPEFVFSLLGDVPSEQRLLAESLRDQLVAQDADARILEDKLPLARPDRVVVAVGDPEPLAKAPGPVRTKTIRIAFGTPGNEQGAAGGEIADLIALTVSPNFAAVEQMRKAGWRAAHLQLGYEPAWDRCEEVAGDPPLTLIEGLGEAPYFDWLASLLAIHRGTVVLHEHSIGYLPLRPGQHIFVAARERLNCVAAALEQDPERRRQTATAAHDFLARLVPMSVAASALLGHARALLMQPVA